MKKIISLILTLFVSLLCGCSNKSEDDKKISKSIDNMVLVKGGSIKNEKSRYASSNKEISDFYIGKYEVTQKEWNEVMDNNPSKFKGDNLPVEMVSWYDCIEYCNKRSEKEELKPYYNIDKNKKDRKNTCQYDEQKWSVTINEDADGYRLPTELEWEYAAEGGNNSKSFDYSGSSNIEDVAWYWKNAGDNELTGDWNWANIEKNNNKTKDVGAKQSNEIGLYDMSGNVREWCFDWYRDAEAPDGFYKVWKGGGFIGDARACESYYRGKFEPNGMGSDQGFRICKNK
ncbi:MAG: formylglycine-generating enzyme family protein [Clostridium sp.]|nr:formylglycine-generating enzyme family protein [Clostridium sp.]